MNTEQIVAELQNQRSRIDEAMSVLSNGRFVHKQHMSAEARRHIAEGLKRSWAERTHGRSKAANGKLNVVDVHDIVPTRHQGKRTIGNRFFHPTRDAIVEALAKGPLRFRRDVISAVQKRHPKITAKGVENSLMRGVNAKLFRKTPQGFMIGKKKAA